MSDIIGKKLRITHSFNSIVTGNGTIAGFKGYPPLFASIYDIEIYYNGAAWATNYVNTITSNGSAPLPPVGPGINTQVSFIMPGGFDGNLYIGNTNVAPHTRPFGTDRAIKKVEILYP